MVSQSRQSGSTTLHRSRLFQAIACSLVMGVCAPAFANEAGSISAFPNEGDKCMVDAAGQLAGECSDNAFASYRFQMVMKSQGGIPAAISSNAAAANSLPPVTANAVMGEIGRDKAATWRSDEFKQDWGLGAIGADHAYARGLTGSGIRVGVFDSGVGLQHPEFAGKDNRGIAIGDLLADGSRCAPNSYIAGDTTCFGTDGGRPSVDAYWYDSTFSPYSAYRHLVNKITYEFGSHGTHVAGTMTANRDGNGMHGVAFGANFTSARLFSDSMTRLGVQCVAGRCTIVSRASYGQGASNSAFVDMYTQMNAQGVRAINHSWGLSREPTTAAALDALYRNPANAGRWEAIRDGSLTNGMIQVWAAGNTAAVIPNPGTASPIAGAYATLPRHMPELEQYWLSVVNLSRTGTDDNPGYTLSNRSMKCGLSMNWCLAAPGTLINSAVYGVEGEDAVGIGIVGGSIDDLLEDADGNFSLKPPTMNPIFEYSDYSGTSMAAPHVTGALALLFERYPYLTNPQVRDVMLTTATDIGAPGVDEVYGWGMLNLKKAIEGFGQFRVDTAVVMNAKAGGVNYWTDGAWDQWTNDIGGPGRFTFSSSAGGWLRLTGNNSFNGLTVNGGLLELTGTNKLTSNVEVNGGGLLLRGSLDGSQLTIKGGVAEINGTVVNGATVVNAGGRLQGTGKLGNTTVFGTIAPGNSIGTLTINGNYVQKAGSFFNVEMQPPSASDLLQVNGTATLEGGTVRAIRLPGVFMLGQSYNFLNATGGVSGRFAGVDTASLGPFLAMSLRYTANSVYADVSRGASLASVAGTWNQRVTAGALDGLPDSNALLQTMVLLPDAASANRAFDQLSGELHPSVRGMLVEDGRHLRNAALSRARTGQDAFTGQSGGPGFSVWADLLANGGSLESDGNAAYGRYSGHQWLVGADYQFDGGFRIGAMGGTQETDFNVGQRDSKARVKGRTLGVYGGQRWGGFGLHGGYTQTRQDVSTERRINFPGLSAQTNAKYDATTQQAFLEGGYLFGGQPWQVEPYLQYAQVRVETDGFSESGGIAALSSGDETSKVGLATAGVRFNVNLKGSQQEQTWLSLRGGLAYRHANGDVVQASQLRFAGSNAFSVHGTPIADRATLGELGVAARLSERTLLEVGYSGQFSDEGRDHGANARLTIKF